MSQTPTRRLPAYSITTFGTSINLPACNYCILSIVLVFKEHLIALRRLGAKESSLLSSLSPNRGFHRDKEDKVDFKTKNEGYR